MKTLERIIKRAKLPEPTRFSLPYTIQKINAKKRLVTGQVYAPDSLDSHGHFMTASELEKTAHKFMRMGLQNQIDVMHDNEVISACIVESFIARGHPLYEEGAWVATTKIDDRDTWNKVLHGEINGYSFEILTYKEDVDVEIEFDSWYYGFTDPDPVDNHTHAYMVKMDNEGNVLWGYTSEENRHRHYITRSNITSKSMRHSHRIHLESTNAA